MESSGIKFYNSGGTQQECFALMKSIGMNTVRLRVWVNPSPAWNNAADVVAKALRAKALGLRIMIDFHYSDSWADPGKQPTPEQWKTMSHTDRVQALFDYTRDTIAAFRDAGVLPEMVQIGNEITHGMLWPDGKLPNWDNFADYLRAGVKGVEAGRGDGARPKILLQLAEDGKPASTKYFFDKINSYNIHYDIIGFSYYPWWHGSLADLQSNLAFAANEYGKDVIVVETAYYWQENGETKNKLRPYPETPEGQRDSGAGGPERGPDQQQRPGQEERHRHQVQQQIHAIPVLGRVVAPLPREQVRSDHVVPPYAPYPPR